MKISPRSAILCSATVAAALLLGACGKKEPAANPPAVAGTAATTPAPAPTPAATTAPAPAPATTAAIKPTPAAAGTTASAIAPATPATAAAAAPADNALTVAKVTVGDVVNADHQVTRAGTSFPTNEKTIYASVATEGRSAGATLNAKWSYLEGNGQMISSVSQAIATEGPAVTTFKVQNPDLWPEGKYKVEISLDGKSVSEQNFEIKKR
ncbi:hypothetical protein [Rhodanobacter sp. L36]|uniref:hypothetical protein n=1 Tax=Rhodanobacter sp. L36 TaxID=1747221 RepID=UPI00131BAE8F|nr:hypothetical protein [Rhodanobacter sp. L36]